VVGCCEQDKEHSQEWLCSTDAVVAGLWIVFLFQVKCVRLRLEGLKFHFVSLSRAAVGTWHEHKHTPKHIFHIQVFWNVRQYRLKESQWPRHLRRGSASARLLGLWVPIPPRARTSVSSECCQVKVFVSCWSLVQRSPATCGVSKWVWSWSLHNEEAVTH
jgi:hypothetical protein